MNITFEKIIEDMEALFVLSCEKQDLTIALRAKDLQFKVLKELTQSKDQRSQVPPNQNDSDQNLASMAEIQTMQHMFDEVKDDESQVSCAKSAYQKQAHENTLRVMRREYREDNPDDVCDIQRSDVRRDVHHMRGNTDNINGDVRNDMYDTRNDTRNIRNSVRRE